MDEHRLIGVSAPIRDLIERIESVARSNSNILVVGESGAGKEIVARSIHAQSARAAQPLVTINCAGFPDTLLESELFGHERGAFTGADRNRGGVLKAAHRGTLFMDEVGEMSLRMQAVLLRFLESGEIQRVGADRQGPRADLRLVAATNRNLDQAVASGEFRQDLYFRLNVIQIVVPPLRERRDDVPVLLEWFGRSFSQRYGAERLRIGPDAMELLVAYDWPGNVRELRNVVERLVIAAGTSTVSAHDLPSEFTRQADPQPPPLPVSRPPAEELFERIVHGGESFWTAAHDPFMARDLTRAQLRALIQHGIEHTGGDQRELARCFKVIEADRKRFFSFVRRYGHGSSLVRTVGRG